METCPVISEHFYLTMSNFLQSELKEWKVETESLRKLRLCIYVTALSAAQTL
jgi:hypothetical protein